MKKFFQLILLLLFGLSANIASAQTTTVTGTVSDPDGFNWFSGTIQFNLYNPSSGQVTYNGIPLTAAQIFVTVNLDSGGSFSTPLNNNLLLQPVGTQWIPTVCPAASAPCQQLARVTISGTSQSLTSTINSQLKALRFPASYTARAYGNIEISPVPPNGGTYYDLTLIAPQFWNGTAWVGFSSASGCTSANCVITNPTVSQTINQPANTNFTLNLQGSSGNPSNFVVNGGTQDNVQLGTLNANDFVFLYGQTLIQTAPVSGADITLNSNTNSGNTLHLLTGGVITESAGNTGSAAQGVINLTAADQGSVFGGAKGQINETASQINLNGAISSNSFTPGTAPICPNGTGGALTQSGCASSSGGITQLTGDITAGPGSGSQTGTLATVNSSPGACGDATHVCQITTNGKGLTTAQTAVAISSGSGGLPTATQPGQIISSTSAGTTYAVQGQVFYNQSGDTIASIESECSSLCTYVVTVPQTITLAANHTLASNVNLQFQAGGKWTVNGLFNLTIPGNVQGTLNQHFTGTSTLAFGLSQIRTNVEWFGAVADGTWNGTTLTGTDNTMSIQTCLNAISIGQCVLQGGIYKVSSALIIAKSAIGLTGPNNANINSTVFTATANAARIITSSASADIIDVVGTSTSNNLSANRLERFNVERALTPTGTATGISLSFTSGVTLSDIGSNDSVRDFYFHSTGSGGTGRIENCIAQVGFNGFVESSGSYYGYYLDSTDGNPNPSLRIRHSHFASNLGATPTTYGMYSTGFAVEDLMVWNFETAGASFGEYFLYSGSGTNFSASDIHFHGTINDQFTNTAFFISGLTAANGASFEINGGESATTGVGASKIIDIENSTGVNVNSHQMRSPSASGNPPIFILVNGSSPSNSFTNNQLSGLIGIGIEINGSGANGNVISNNVITGNSLGSTALIDVIGAFNVVISGNTLGGHSTNGILLDSSTINTTGLDVNSFTGTFTNNINNAGFNPVYILNGVLGPGTTPSGSCGSIHGHWNLSQTGGAVWCNGGTWSSNFTLNASGLFGTPNITVGTITSPSIVPLYNTTGTLQTSAHMVNGSGTLSGGTLTVTFSGAAVFTSSSSYVCNPDDSTGINGIDVVYTSGTSVTFNGTASDSFRFTCTGN